MLPEAQENPFSSGNESECTCQMCLLSTVVLCPVMLHQMRCDARVPTRGKRRLSEGEAVQPAGAGGGRRRGRDVSREHCHLFRRAGSSSLVGKCR